MPGLGDDPGVAEGGHLAGLSPLLSAALTGACAAVSHNLHGQRLGRKGRVTRERILATAIELIETSDEPVTLARVARSASLGMTSVYNYFPDMTELLLAALEPVMATAREDYLLMLGDRWPDEGLYDHCYAFVRRYHDFWQRHSRLLHLRNAMADHQDVRMLRHRIEGSRPIIALLVRQMSDEPLGLGPHTSMATMVMIGIERSVTLTTDREFCRLVQMEPQASEERSLVPGARLIEFAIRDARSGSPPGPAAIHERSA